MPDYDAITTAIALRFDPSTITAPAGGYDNVRVSTGNLPNQMVPLPAVLVFPSNGEFLPQTTGARRDSDTEFVVRFYYNQTGDLPRDTVALRKWLTILVTRLDGAVQLGGTVTLARVVSWRVDVFDYALLQYTGIELVINVHVEEAVTAVA